MGREVRMVPPMFDETFESAAAKWKAEFAKWEKGERPSYYSDEYKTDEYWEYEGSPPERAYYRPWQDAEATWFQVWETVSEGTPVTPPFATKAALVDYLVANGDFWDQSRSERGSFMAPKKLGWDRKAAESFVDAGFALSMVVQSGPEGVKIYEPRDGMPA